MKKSTRLFMIALALLASSIAAIDTLLYLFVAPGRSLRMVCILVALLAVFNLPLFFLQVKRKVIAIQWILILLYCFQIVFIAHLSSQREMAKFAATNVQLDMFEEVLLKYHSEHGEFPLGLKSTASYFVRGEQGFKDPFCRDEWFQYMALNKNVCIIYSRGPDRVDNNGIISVDSNAIYYSPMVLPWTGMPFAKYILRGSGFDEKIKGDIVRRIEVAPA